MERCLRCLWLKAIGKHILISIFNKRVFFMFEKFKGGNIIFQLGWLSLFYCRTLKP